MSSTERAPEPTMEEILASIRRIISDDESSMAKQHTPSASRQDEEGLEAAEGEADDKIINDIARVLSGSASAAEEEEEILDLTAELGGLEPVELEQPLPEDASMDEVVAEAPAVFQSGPQAAAAPAPEPVVEAPAPEPAAPPSPPMSASEEAASALERAIAALRAGHVPTSVPGFMPKSEPAPEPAPFAAAPQSEPEPVSEPEPEPEVELILTEFEEGLIVEEPAELEAAAPSEPDESSGWESETAPWVGAPEPLVEPERYAPRTNGGSAHGDASHDIGNKTLEDSVKDMLRPMLRQWLDENMARVLTSALKDELRSNPARFQRD
jgi:uncharacterized protein